VGRSSPRDDDGGRTGPLAYSDGGGPRRRARPVRSAHGCRAPVRFRDCLRRARAVPGRLRRRDLASRVGLSARAAMITQSASPIGGDPGENLFGEIESCSRISESLLAPSRSSRCAAPELTRRQATRRTRRPSGGAWTTLRKSGRSCSRNR
jgi:hypothetical protein